MPKSSPEPVAKKDATDGQKANYTEAMTATEAGLQSSMKQLNARRAVSADPDEVRACDIKHHEYESEFLKMQAEELSYLDDSFRFRPPLADTVAQMKAIVVSLDKMVAASIAVTNIVQATEDLLIRWKATRA